VTWELDRRVGGAQALHDRAFTGERCVTVCDAERRAIVLGSTQAAPAAASIEVARRRSGGGAVVVGREDVLWVDIDLPAGDPLWERDVGRSFWWLGQTWAAALARLGVDAVEIHHGAVVCTPWCAQVCFGGIGQGEITVAGRKVVGLAQRRIRQGARFHCAAMLQWDPAPLLEAFGLPAEAQRGLAEVVGALDVGSDDLEAAFLDALPA
jgi:lipoate-protein ligase A